MNARHFMHHSKQPAALTAAALITAAMVIQGCSKKVPPPPPPPPPPAPVFVPPPVDVKSILQSVKADPRVQTAPGVAVTDETFLRSAVMLADAIATGDAAKMEPLLTRRAKETLALVKAGGGLEKSAKEIEIVRIVLASPPTAMSGDERVQAMTTWSQEFTRGAALRDDAWTRKGYTKEEVTRFEAAARESFLKELVKLSSDASSESAIDGKPEFVVLMAIQDPRGAYLLGWSGLRDGSGWIFNNASTVPIERNRASEWDDVGMFGFSLGTGEILPDALPKELGGKGASGKDGEKGADGADAKPTANNPTPAPAKDGEPTKRSTPNGPINIPKPGGR